MDLFQTEFYKIIKYKIRAFFYYYVSDFYIESRTNLKGFWSNST